MRRALRCGLPVLAVLVVLAGGYGAYWTIVAGRIEDGVAQWARTARARRLDVSWHSIGVGGFPARFRIELRNAALRDRSLAPAPELHVPVLSGDAVPWNPAIWRVGAPAGVTADLAGAGSRPALRLVADEARGVLTFRARGGVLWLRLRLPRATAGGKMRASDGDLWIDLPAERSPETAPSLGLAALLHQMEVPALDAALGGGIDQLAFGVTVKGTLPSGNLVRSVARWRDAGGTVDLDNFAVEWNGLAATATGSFALDQDLQPTGGFSAAIEGYDRILRALVETGRLRPAEAGLAQLALTLLAKAGTDGRPQIATSLTITHGELFLGPARLGPAPRLAWK